MSNSLSETVRERRFVAAGLLALMLLALAAVGMAPRAQADFSLGKCEGSDVLGEGSSFQKEAQKLFNEHFANDYCVGTSGQGSVNITYGSTGSGAGIKSMELRTGTSRFGGTDDPPTAAQVALMNSGAVDSGGGVLVDDGLAGDDGKVHVVPVAVGAVAPLVNFPDGCNPESLADEYRTVSAAEVTGTPAKKGLVRVRFPKEMFEKVWARETGYEAWDEVFPELHGTAACEKPIIRVVRFDKSGTTFTLKDYLSRIDPAREWTTKYESGTANGNREWPGAEFGTGGQCGGTAAPGKQDDSVDHLTSGCSNGNGGLVPVLQSTDGSIGYSDLATARADGTVVDPALTSEAPTTPYWTQVQNGHAGTPEWTEPTFSATGYQKNGAQGSNCKSVSFTGLPGSTLGDWSKASGVNSPVGYGICTLTYVLLFDDNAAAWGNNPEEEAKARTVKDYWENIIGPAIQGQLFGRDYAALPDSIRQIAQAGIDEIGWNKSASGSNEETGGNNTSNNANTGGGSSKATISNLFTLTRKSISSKTGGAVLSVKLPGAGKLDVLGKAKVGKRKLTVSHVVLTAGKAGTFKVNLKPKGAAKKALKKAGKLKVSLKLTFTPNGGTARTSRSSLTLKMHTKSGRKSKRHHMRHDGRR